MREEMKMPYIKFFTRDWLNEPRLRLCSPAARGLWIDLICLMAGSEKHGYLVHNGRPFTDSELSILISVDKDTVKGLLNELKSQGVCSVDDKGCIFSRRLVADESKRAKASESGKRGGNPALLYSLPTLKSGEDITQNPEPTDGLTTPLKGLVSKSADFLAIWQSFVEHRRQIGHPLTIKAAGLILSDCQEWGPKDAVVALKNSIKNGWRGVFAPKQQHGKPSAHKPQSMSAADARQVMMEQS